MTHAATRFHVALHGFTACFAFVLALGLRESAAQDAPSNPPNLVLVLIDDLGPEWIGGYGGESARTPNVDRLAQEGLRFENAWAMPKCTPTRASLLTGRYPFRHGWVNHWDVPRWGASCHFDPAHELTFARVLRQAGYRTAIAGKWQINDFRVQPRVLEAHGFEAWCMWTGYETGNPPSAERYHDPYVVRHDAEPRTLDGAFGPDVFTAFLTDFARAHADEPFLLYYPMVLTHGPLVAPPTEPDVRGKERFAAMVRHADHLIGTLVEALDELPNERDTIVIVTGDNGSPGGITGRRSGRDVLGGKGKLSETGCSVPFVVRSRGGAVPKGRVTAALTDVTDLFPTLLDLAGVELPRDHVLDGRSIAPVLRGASEHGPRSWILSMGGGVARIENGRVRPTIDHAPRVLRDPRYKVWFENGRPHHLYDLVQDPTESRDLLANPSEEAQRSLDTLVATYAAFPKKDAWPRYDPTPKQTWDRK
ncbi:MAG: sulfatase-like hydrolase/transferase [Planctomycetes bacterium]|nr:sulfatase-like hydrolase/transferase [Planctomycetota bacterium]